MRAELEPKMNIAQERYPVIYKMIMESLGPLEKTVQLMMDRAYEEDKTQLTAWGLRFNPVVPPKKNRKNPWKYDKELYKRRKYTAVEQRYYQGNVLLKITLHASRAIE